MSNSIEWVDADAATIDWTTTPGEWADPFGSTNDGVAVSFGSIIMEGTVAELEDFMAQLQQAISEIEEALTTDDD